MRILFVALAASTHTARWVSQLRNTGWEIHVFDPTHGLIHPDLTGVRVHTGWKKEAIPDKTQVTYRWPFLRGRHFIQNRFPKVWQWIVPPSPIFLANLIKELNPDCIHSLGMQQASYIVAEAKKLIGSQLPCPWMYSSWGSDYFYWGKFPEHYNRIRDVLDGCNYLLCDCKRDIALAYEYGFRGKALGVLPGGGGYPVKQMRSMCVPGRVSERRVIAVKGLQHEVGRAFVALEALSQCVNYLNNYEIVLYQTHKWVEEEARRLSTLSGLQVHVMPHASIEQVWRLFGRSRIALGVSISDGTPNAMLEAMICGAFPIQTNPGGATSEWIENGVNGFTVSPDDPTQIADAIVEAVRNDSLVDSAAQLNQEISLQRLDLSIIQPLVVDLYQQVMNTA